MILKNSLWFGGGEPIVLSHHRTNGVQDAFKLLEEKQLNEELRLNISKALACMIPPFVSHDVKGCGKCLPCFLGGIVWDSGPSRWPKNAPRPRKGGPHVMKHRCLISKQGGQAGMRGKGDKKNTQRHLHIYIVSSSFQIRLQLKCQCACFSPSVCMFTCAK